MIGIKTFCFTVDDNIRFFKEITERGAESIFDHPYLALYRRLHEELDLKLQLNLFYKTEGFELSRMSEAYRREWEESSDWLKLSFHSELENVSPYESSGYDEVYGDCERVHAEIKRFASPAALAKTTTVHFCKTTEEGLRALEDNGVHGLLGLYGTDDAPRSSYCIEGESAARLRRGEILKIGKTHFASIDIVLNCFSIEEILAQLEGLKERESIRVMIHEQYYYKDYVHYQPEFEEKLRATFGFMKENGYQSRFFEELI